ncbi:MAG: hypothetical protein AB7F67_11290 [Rhodospirillaceae bacterium]
MLAGGAIPAAAAHAAPSSDRDGPAVTAAGPPIEAPIFLAAGGEGGEGSEGGEGGEAGVSAEEAAKDPAAFLTAIDVIAAHYLAGQAAYAEGRAQSAGEMFAHPIAEIYVDLEPVFKARGVAPFQAAMEKASALALEKAPKAEVDKAVDTVMAALKAAMDKAPDDGRSKLAVQAAVTGDMIDRAARQYQAAMGDTAEEPYLDGYGFYRAARQRADGLLPELRKAHADAAKAVSDALAALARAYPASLRPAAAPVPPGQVLGVASQAKFAISPVK